MTEGLAEDSERAAPSHGGLAVERVAVVRNARGLHARAAAKFVTICERFTSVTTVKFEEQAVAGSSIMGLMMLGAGHGSVLTLRAEGADAEAAIDALAELVDSRFGEAD